MHRRREFLVYPPRYKPGDGYKVLKSKRQAWRVAVRMGAGATVFVCTRIHPRPRTDWQCSLGLRPLWEVIPAAAASPES